ncbi:hypothetical protein NPIL_516441 [Nephila pilipes]|uniref:Uncharacterized protein n=1 Tax=Nephila pilipes TaxID=299642 RepID=A0A8X6PQN0_NEPPI|nr:hypothetical protein NPIL_516441 [Nephila pilipes]
MVINRLYLCIGTSRSKYLITGADVQVILHHGITASSTQPLQLQMGPSDLRSATSDPDLDSHKKILQRPQSYTTSADALAYTGNASTQQQVLHPPADFKGWQPRLSKTLQRKGVIVHKDRELLAAYMATSKYFPSYGGRAEFHLVYRSQFVRMHLNRREDKCTFATQPGHLDLIGQFTNDIR